MQVKDGDIVRYEGTLWGNLKGIDLSIDAMMAPIAIVRPYADKGQGTPVAVLIELLRPLTADEDKAFWDAERAFARSHGCEC